MTPPLSSLGALAGALIIVGLFARLGTQFAVGHTIQASRWFRNRWP